mgnify:CR=1 FL=1
MPQSQEQHMLIPNEDTIERDGTAPLAGIAQELVMCCGDNCVQGRLSAGVWTWWDEERRRAKSELMVWWAPWHGPVRVEMPIGARKSTFRCETFWRGNHADWMAELAPADIVWIEIIRVSPKKAQVYSPSPHLLHLPNAD